MRYERTNNVHNRVMGSKIVVFEYFEWSVFPFILFYRILGYQIFALRLKCGLQELFLYKFFRRIMSVRVLYKQGFRFEERMAVYRKVFNYIDGVYDGLFKRKHLIKNVEALIGSDIVHDAYKRVLMDELFEYFGCEFFLKKFHCTLVQKSFNFFPTTFLSYKKCFFSKDVIDNKKDIGIPSGIEIVFLGRLYSLGVVFFGKLKWLFGFCICPLWILFKIKSFRSLPEQRKKYQVGIRVYKNDWGFDRKYRKIDFLLDGKELDSKSVLFCIETDIPDSYRNEFKKRNYDVIEVPRILSVVPFKFFYSCLLKELMTFWAKGLGPAISVPPFFVKLTMENVLTYVSWKRVLKEYDLRHLVVYCDRGPQHIIRNILLKRNDVQTWTYVFSSHTEDLFDVPGRPNCTNVIFAYWYYDHNICWGDRLKKFQLQFPHRIKNFSPLGCFWAEHVREAIEEGGAHEVREQILEGMGYRPEKIIGVFDTTFFYGTPLNADEIRLFLKGILNFVDTHKDTCMALKRKWKWSDMMDCVPELKNVYEAAERHSRCKIFNPDESDPADIIAASDIVISACFTSPTIEALGAGKKGVFFDPNNCFRGCYYDNIPRFVAHDQHELNSFLEYWLSEATSQDFKRWREKYIKNEIHYNLKGTAISEFRGVLTKN